MKNIEWQDNKKERGADGRNNSRSGVLVCYQAKAVTKGVTESAPSQKENSEAGKVRFTHDVSFAVEFLNSR